MKRYPEAALTALDYSVTSVETTRKTNRNEIAAGRCSVVQASVESLPFTAGFSEVRSDRHPEKPWLAVTARK